MFVFVIFVFSFELIIAMLHYYALRRVTKIDANVGFLSLVVNFGLFMCWKIERFFANRFNCGRIS